MNQESGRHIFKRILGNNETGMQPFVGSRILIIIFIVPSRMNAPEYTVVKYLLKENFLGSECCRNMNYCGVMRKTIGAVSCIQWEKRQHSRLLCHLHFFFSSTTLTPRDTHTHPRNTVPTNQPTNQPPYADAELLPKQPFGKGIDFIPFCIRKFCKH